MATPAFNITGLASGLDTQSIVEQLMALERQPVKLLEARKAELTKVDSAWGAVNTKLSALRAAMDKVGKPDAMAKLVTATSSNEDAVAVTRTGAPTPGSVTFTVTGLASIDQKAVGGTFTAADALVGAGSLSVTQDGVGHTVDTDGKTLAQVAAELNDNLEGVSAQVVKLSEDAYQLVVASKATGTANAVSVDTSAASAGMQATTVLQTAADATLDLGGGVVVTRASNTITDLVDGVTMRLKEAGATVTVSSEQDVDGVVAAVQELATALNATLSTLGDHTDYDAETETAGALQGDPTARQLILDLRGALSAVVSGAAEGSDFTSLSSIGLAADRYGAVALDEGKLRAALASDFEGVTAVLTSSSGSSDPRVRLTGATPAAASGSLTFDVVTPARIASAIGGVYTPPGPGYPKSFTITTAQGTVTIELEESEATVAAAVAKINSELAADPAGAGVRARATDDGLGIRFAAPSAGSAHHVDLDDPQGLFGQLTTVTGQDVVVARDGVNHVGTGGAISIDGVSVVITDGVTGMLGPVTVSNGLDAALRRAEGSDGSVQRARDTLDRRVRAYQDSIDGYDFRLSQREITLRRKYAALETALASMQSQTAWMASQLGAPTE